MNKNVVLAVAKRDLRSWFGNPANYVFITLFVGVSCAVMMWSAAFFTNNLANLDTLNLWFPWIAAIFVAAATMGMWTSERANGTQELLFTLPASDLELQLGKFVAYVAMYTVSLAFTLILPLALIWLGNPDWGQLFANYVGFWLLGVTLVAISTIGSQLTNSGTIAFLVSVVLCSAFRGSGWLLDWLGFPSWRSNGPLGQFALFAGGQLPLSGIVLFAGMTCTFFALGLVLLSRRHWRAGTEGAHGVARFACLTVATFAATVVGVQKLPRFDATIEGIHSLSDESRKLIASLDPNKTVYITAYVSEEVPEVFVQQRNLLLNLVDQFDSIGGGKIEKSIVMPDPFSPEAKAAEVNYGIRPQQVMFDQAGGGYTRRSIFLGFVVHCGTEDVVTPFVEPALPLEYEIMRSIRTVAGSVRRKVGILKTDLEIMGGIDFQTFRQKPRWQIADELQQQYALENVDPEKDYPAGLACLIVPQPSSLQQEQMDRLQKWMLDGNPTLLLEDPAPYSAPGTAADDEKGGMQARMMGGGGPPKGNFLAVMDSIGLQWNRSEVVWDLSYRTFQGGEAAPEFVFVRGNGIANDSAITKGLQSVVVLWGGHASVAAKEGTTVTPLLRSLAGPNETNGTTTKEEVFQESPFFGMQVNPNPRRVRRNTDLTLAARVTRKATGDKGKGLDVIWVGDLDMISNVFFDMRRRAADATMRFDNVSFLLNCIDTLAGDDSLIELRKRRPELRTLKRVEEAQADFEKKWTTEKDNAEKEADEALKAAQARLNDAVKKIREDATIDEQAKDVQIGMVEQRENRRLENERTIIDDKKKERLELATHDRDVARKGIYDRYRSVTLLLSLVPGLALGILTLVRRSTRAAAIVPASRQVSGQHGSGGAQ
jgi:ABC-2 type transport system permease protein